MKMNVDASFCASSHESTAGVGIRDHLGSVIIAASIAGTTCSNAEEAEAFMVWEGLKIAVNQNQNPATL
jgi:hypothetical protein